MNPLLGLGFVLIVFNIWSKRRIERKIRASQNEPKWNEKIDREKYNEEIKKLQLKYMKEKSVDHPLDDDERR